MDLVTLKIWEVELGERGTNGMSSVFHQGMQALTSPATLGQLLHLSDSPLCSCSNASKI